MKEIGSGEADINQGNVILQIQKLRNVAAPKSNEESRSAPRMLKMFLTDGRNNYQAIEVEHISVLRYKLTKLRGVHTKESENSGFLATRQIRKFAGNLVHLEKYGEMPGIREQIQEICVHKFN